MSGLQRMAQINLALALDTSAPVEQQLSYLIRACQMAKKSYDKWDHEYFRDRFDADYDMECAMLQSCYAQLGRFIVDHPEVLK